MAWHGLQGVHDEVDVRLVLAGREQHLHPLLLSDGALGGARFGQVQQG